MKSKHHVLLNVLDEMQQSPHYALRKPWLSHAEQLIVSQEKEIRHLKKALTKLERMLQEGTHANADMEEVAWKALK